MRAQRLRTVSQALVVLFATGLAAWLVASRSGTGDYILPGPAGGDNAGPPIAALVHGQFGRLPALQTLMGLTSVLWRAPFVALATIFGAGRQLIYDVGAGACLAPVVALVGWIVSREHSAAQLGRASAAAVLMIGGEVTVGALGAGHPEEILTTALTTAAVLCAQADRRTAAAVLLGLAIGSKEWALLATPVVLLALPSGRGRAALIVCAVAFCTTVPLPLLDVAAFRRADLTIGPVTMTGRWSLWWPLTFPTGHRLPFGLTREVASAGGLAAALVLEGLAGRRLRGRAAGGPAPRMDTMAMLALVGLLRCILDSADLGYYLVAAMIPLTVWETGTLRRLPLISASAWAVLAVCFGAPIPFGVHRTALAATAAATPVFVGAALLLAVYLTLRTFLPARPRPRPRPAATQPISAPATKIERGADALRPG